MKGTFTDATLPVVMRRTWVWPSVRSLTAVKAVTISESWLRTKRR
jgi:hypothetical protein